MRGLTRLYQSLIQCLEGVAPLVLRLTMGWIFLRSGWQKWHSLPGVTEFFSELGIPLPGLAGPFVASLEVAGGVLLLLGWYTRLSALPLMGILIVALFTAKSEVLVDINELLESTEYLFVVLLLAICAYGPGKISVDYFWRRKP